MLRNDAVTTEFGVAHLHQTQGGRAPLRRGTRERGIGRMKSNFMNIELTSKIISVLSFGLRNTGRFQVIVDYADVYFLNAFAESSEEAVEAFLVQAPGCDEGEIILFDRSEQRIVASVNWKMDTTEIGLRVAHRQNIFHDGRFALIAMEIRKHLAVAAAAERNA